jgi:hypothetical protein
MRDAEVESPAKHALGHFARLRWAVCVGKIHAAQADGGNLMRTQLS